MTINVVVIDDHTLVREAVCRMIDSEPDLAVVGQAGGIAEGKSVLANSLLHVLVVDVSMPDGSGLVLARAAREASPRLGIVVLTMHNDDETLLEALDLGASALVLKSAPSDEVIAAVRRAAVAPDAFMATGLAEALRRRDSNDKPKLTPRESEVLDRLVAGDSIAAVAKRLYMSESTVKTHVSKVYEKLGAHNRASAVMSALRLGLVKTESVGQTLR
jgi:DNA-binding NarL/FixJ family response regulator